MEAASVMAAGAPTLVETALVLSARLKHDPRFLPSAFLREAEVATILFSEGHFEVDVEAFFRFGKGRHPAALNFGDLRRGTDCATASSVHW